MKASLISIIPYTRDHQPGIDAMMDEIRKEFSKPLTPPKSEMPAHMHLPPDPYWVALCDGELSGTSGITVMKNNLMALRRMFVKKQFRGREISPLLLKQAINWAVENKATAVYLGTMSQFTAAQRFYEKNGFTQIPKEDLPPDFPINPVDTFFYKMEITKPL